MDACKISLPNDQPLQIGVQIIDMVNDKEISISLLRYQFVRIRTQDREMPDRFCCGYAPIDLHPQGRSF